MSHRLQQACNLMRNTNGGERWTAEEWLKLYDAYMASDWDITPCRWTPLQVERALAGIPPKFDDHMRPIEEPSAEVEQ